MVCLSMTFQGEYLGGQDVLIEGDPGLQHFRQGAIETESVISHSRPLPANGTGVNSYAHN